MKNNISITLRLPEEVNNKLDLMSERSGITKTNLLRLAIHEKLPISTSQLLADSPSRKTATHRLVLNVNQPTYGLLMESVASHQISMNQLIIALVDLIDAPYSKE